MYILNMCKIVAMHPVENNKIMKSSLLHISFFTLQCVYNISIVLSIISFSFSLLTILFSSLYYHHVFIALLPPWVSSPISPFWREIEIIFRYLSYHKILYCISTR
uniref:Uncharacterized protein n=1 Tax=Cacopsylla melanoneura TaxID=428564 RepID=A0A8D9AYX4_9HEMI